jgi:hypothetical protein
MTAGMVSRDRPRSETLRASRNTMRRDRREDSDSRECRRPGGRGFRRHVAHRGSSVPLVRDAREAVTAYWVAASERDWGAFSELLAEDVVYEGPQTRERVRGRANYVRFNVEGFRVTGAC